MITDIFQAIAAIFGGLVLLISIPLFIRFKWPAPVMWFTKLYVSALSPLFAVIGGMCAIAGLVTGSIFITLVGLFSVIIYVYHIVIVTRPPAKAEDFDQAFGLDWKKSIRSKTAKNFLPSRFILKLPVVPKAQIEKDVPFATIPGTDRKLLCDIWQPGENIKRSGLAFIFFHGSAFYILDKDYGTRPLFRRLAAQGHVIMDVAYRLAPETDIMGMIHDAKRAVIWMKEHSGIYGINKDNIVLGGGSSGGHLALMTGYTSMKNEFMPADILGKDANVRGIVALYPATDLKALYYHTNQHLTTRNMGDQPRKTSSTKMPAFVVRAMGKDTHRLGFDKPWEKVGTLAPLLGGHPDEFPERYAELSPVNHVHSKCPPTLLIHGEHDIMAPVDSTKELYSLLSGKNIPTVIHLLPQCEHAFDLIKPAISPAAHNAFYDVERFLGLMAAWQASKTENVNTLSKIPSYSVL